MKVELDTSHVASPLARVGSKPNTATISLRRLWRDCHVEDVWSRSAQTPPTATAKATRAPGTCRSRAARVSSLTALNAFRLKVKAFPPDTGSGTLPAFALRVS